MAIHVLLDRSKRYYFTCCGCLHVHIALIIIFLFVLIIDTAEIIGYIFDPDVTLSSPSQLLVEIVEFAATVTLGVAVFKQWAHMLIPFMGLMMTLLALELIFFAYIVLAVITPYSEFAKGIVPYSTDDTFIGREIVFLFILSFQTMIVTINYWILHVTMLSYRYYQDREAERLTREGRPNLEAIPTNPPQVRPPLVIPTKPSTSFPNPNFSLEDDEEDQVFEKKPNAANIV